MRATEEIIDRITDRLVHDREKTASKAETWHQKFLEEKGTPSRERIRAEWRTREEKVRLYDQVIRIIQWELLTGGVVPGDRTAAAQRTGRGPEKVH